jgi:hypothetical protein
MRGAKNTVIDCEETTVATEEGLFIHHNWLDHSLGRTKAAVSLGGTAAAALATRCRFTDNYVTGGSVSCLSGDKAGGAIDIRGFAYRKHFPGVS